MRNKLTPRQQLINEKAHSVRKSKPSHRDDLNNPSITTTKLVLVTKGDDTTKKGKLDRRKYVLIVAVSLLLYVNSLNGEFVHDDLLAVVRNKDVTSPERATNFLHNDFWGKSMQDQRSHKSYRPLTVLSFRLNYLLHGLSPISFHIFNIVLHAAVCVLFMKVCRNIVFTKIDDDTVLYSGLLFAVHPIHTEGVSGIVGRADLLAGLFFLLSFSVYARNIPGIRSSQSTYLPVLGSVLFATCAMLCKEQGITVLAVNAGYDVLHTTYELLRMKDYQFRKSLIHPYCRSMVGRVAMVTIATVVLLFLRMSIMGGTLPLFLEEDNPASFSESFLTRFLTYSFLITFNCWLLLCPKTLSYDWQVGSIPLVESVWDWRNLSSVVVFMVLSILVMKVIVLQAKDGKPVALGLMFLIIPFLPASNIFLTVGFVVAERILYIPSMGFCILVAFGISSLKQILPSKHYLLQPAIIFTLAIFAARTVMRNTDWNSRDSLFRSGLMTLPHNAKMHYNWANYQRDVNNTLSAVLHYRDTIRLYPDHASAHNNLATLLTEEHEKEFHLQEALRIDSYHVNAHVNLAMLRSEQGNQSLALLHLKHAISIDPDNYEAISNIAVMMTSLEDFKEAEQYHKRAMMLQPGNADVVNNYGVLFLKMERFAEAMFYFDKTLAIQPRHVTAMGNLGLLHMKQGQIQDAEQWYLRASLTERTSSTLKGLAGFYYSIKKWIQARDTYRELLVLAKDDIDSILQYGQVLINLDAQAEGEIIFDATVEAFTGHLELRRALANIKSSLQKYEEALSHLEEALTICQTDGFSDAIQAKIRFEYANNLKSLGRYPEATKEYDLATILDPAFSSAFLNMGALLHLQGDYEVAKEKYHQALHLDPDNLILKENLKKLERLMKRRRQN